MICYSFSFKKSIGWTCQEFPAIDSENTLILVFGASQLLDDSKPLDDLLQNYPRSLAIGCSTSGEILDKQIDDESLCVAIIKFNKTRIKACTEHINNTHESEVIGEKIAQSLIADDLKAVFLLTDGLNVNGSSLIRGLLSQFEETIPISGGMAADGEEFQRTWVLANKKPEQNAVTAIGFYGSELCFETTSQGGWDVFGPERTITRAHENVLYELDGKPALTLYKEYLGELAQGLPATGLLFPISILEQETQQEIVRTITSVNESDNSLTLAGDIPQGARTKLMHANPERLINGASDAAETLVHKSCESSELFVIAISCFGRRAVLKERSEEEVEAVTSALPAHAHLMGFYSYGEFSPNFSGVCTLHNQTMTLTMIGECDDT